MAELDPLIAKVLLQGDDELLKSLEKVGVEGAEHIKALAEAADRGAGPLEVLGGSIIAIGAAITGTAAALVAFIEQQTELSQATELLANAFGTTAGQLIELEQIFASSGVKVQQFERFATRLTTTIAREWPQIAESIKTYANENDAAQLRISSAILRISDAQKNLADHSDERSAQMSKDNDAVEASYIKLEHAAQHAASEQLGALQSLRGAQLSVEAAEQHLAELEGRPPSAAAKQNLALAQAQQAVDTARKAEADARLAQQEKAENAALKMRQAEQEAADAQRKAAKNARDDAEQRVKDENAVKEAIIARGEAEQRAEKFALTNVVSIKSALKGVVDGNKEAATAIDLSEVSVQNLTKGMFALAAESNKGVKPEGFQALSEISKVLTADTGHLIDREQRLAIVTHLAGTSMQALGKSASEILDVLENDGTAIEDLTKHADALSKVDPAGIKNFRAALTQLNLALSLLSQQFGAFLASGFASFLNGVKDSLTDTDGVLHNLIEGFKILWEGISDVVSVAKAIGQVLNEAFSTSTEKANGLRNLMIAIAVVVGLISGPFIAIPILIGLVVLALGELKELVAKNKEAIQDWWASWEKTPAIQVIERILDGLKKIAGYLSGPLKALFGGGNAVRTSSGDIQTLGNTPIVGAVEGHAEGGLIRGPGTTTSDSILARLSRGEYVIKTAAVQSYGENFFHALNNMMLPGFASGGLVPAPVRMASGSVPATSTLNLSIDGRSFNGLRGPKSTIDDLSSFAIARQASAAGNNPSWMK